MQAISSIAVQPSRRVFALSALVFAGITVCGIGTLRAAERGVVVPAPSSDVVAPASNTETAVLAGGCFWGVQAVFQHVQGVSNVVSGYAGGAAETAKYPVVSSGSTGHAEAVRISYDPKKISYGRLLQIYFSVAHNPTELNRQGPDSGTQYRSAIFPANAEQTRVARSYIDQLNRSKTFGKDLATTLEPLKAFYPAEAYHQDFLNSHPDHPYIVVNDMPKIGELKRLFPAVYADKPVLVATAVGAAGAQ